MSKITEDKAKPKLARKGGSKRFSQGYYELKNPGKYVGDVTKVRFMSSWEKTVHVFLDSNPNVLRWGSETLAIPYIKPTDGRIHKYYPDYWIEFVTKQGEIKREVIEVKPASQTRPPRANSKHALFEHIQLAVNQAKWAAAVKWCNERNMTFRIWTENQIYK